MAETGFDRLILALAATGSRRGFSRVVARMALAGPLAAFPGWRDAAGKKRKRKKKRKCKDCGPCDICRKGKCQPAIGICPSGQICLSNGSCALECGVDGSICGAIGCGGGCPQTIEGTGECALGVPTCAGIPRVCGSTAECPKGEHCELTSCPEPYRCVPLCTGLV